MSIDKMGQVVQHGRAKSSLDIQGTIKKVQGVEKRQQSGTIGGGARASPLEEDCWKTTGEEVVRIHSQPRSALFAVTAKYAEYNSLGPVRTTRGTDQAGNDFVLHDFWRAARRPHRHQPFLWTGTTTFHQVETS